MGGASHDPRLLRVVASEVLVTQPRCIKAGQVVIGTRRCSERRFFLRPDPAMDYLFKYCLARAARLTGVLIHEFQVLSNHYHVVLTDVRGNRPKFFQELNQFVARAGNRHLRRWENFFAPGSYNAPVLVDGDAIEAECIYTLCNAVKHGLVPQPEYWDGVCSWSMEYGESETIRRPEGFFAKDMRDEEILTLVRPLDLYPDLSDTDARTQLRKRACARAHVLAEEIRSNGGGFMGMKRVRRQPTNSSPDTRAPRRGIKPTVAGKNKWARIEALQRNQAFLEGHRNARLRFEAGEYDVVFPNGTYQMVQRYGVDVEEN